MTDDATRPADDLIARLAAVELEQLAADLRLATTDPPDRAASIHRALRANEEISAELEALLLTTSTDGAAAPAPVAGQRGSRRRVLVVDDDPAIRAALALTFEDEGYEARAVGDGRAALALLAAWPPDVIVLDLLMPVMDGPSFRAAQLALAELARIPVIVLSAAQRPDRLAEPLQPLTVLPKPCDPDALLGAVRHATAVTS